ncbi:MAG: helix-hairpin-helix domain-containing protein [Thermoplasmatota archaeon]
MILTNLNIIPGRRIESTLGIAYGYASVKKGKRGKPVLDLNGEETPWKDASEDFEALFRAAESGLRSSGEKLGGDAVVKVEGKLSRDAAGNPEMLLMGTAVKLSEEGAELEMIEGEKAKEGQAAGAVSVKFDGENTDWSSPQATTPTMDVLKKIRERGVKDVSDYRDDTRRILLLTKEVGIPQERARLLIDGGYDTVEKIARAGVGDISSIDGINPTQARIIRKKAIEMLEGE